MNPSSPSYFGLYINLDRSVEREKAFQSQLAALDLQSRYTRFPAVDGAKLDTSRSPLRPGEVGVFLSHCRALEHARGKRMCVHILEDDALLSEHVAPVLDGAVAAGYFEQYDLLFTDMTIQCHVGFLRNVKTEFDKIVLLPRPWQFNQLRLIDMSQTFHARFQSYVVGAKSIDRMVGLYNEELTKGPSIPVDIFIQQQVLAGKIRAAAYSLSSRVLVSKT